MYVPPEYNPIKIRLTGVYKEHSPVGNKNINKTVD